jgi:hypothetical protein
MSTTIKCKECKDEFTISDREEDFYKNRNLSLPKRCKKCRDKKRQKEGLRLKDCIGKWVKRTRPIKYNGDRSWVDFPIIILSVNEKENEFSYYNDFCYGNIRPIEQLNLYDDTYWIIDENYSFYHKYTKKDKICEFLGRDYESFRLAIEKSNSDYYINEEWGMNVLKSHTIKTENELFLFFKIVSEIMNLDLRH